MERPRWRDVSMWRNPQLPPPSPAPREILPHALGYVPRFVEIYKEKSRQKPMKINIIQIQHQQIRKNSRIIQDGQAH